MIHEEDEQDEPREEKGFEEPPEFVKGLEVEPNLREEEHRPDGKYKGDDGKYRGPEEEDPEARRLRLEREKLERQMYIYPDPPKDPAF